MAVRLMPIVRANNSARTNSVSISAAPRSPLLLTLIVLSLNSFIFLLMGFTSQNSSGSTVPQSYDAGTAHFAIPGIAIGDSARYRDEAHRIALFVRLGGAILMQLSPDVANRIPLDTTPTLITFENAMDFGTLKGVYARLRQKLSVTDVGLHT